jgi:hypothetical protein
MVFHITSHMAPRVRRRIKSLKKQPIMGMRVSSPMTMVPTTRGQKNAVAMDFLR